MSSKVHFSPPTLHDPVLSTDAEKAAVGGKLHAISAQRVAKCKAAAAGKPPVQGKTAAASPPPPALTIQLTTVSKSGGFDSKITIMFRTPTDDHETLLVDSGNSTLIVPHGEKLVGQPTYEVLGQATEPWGCPCSILRGAIDIPLEDGSIYTLEDCIFYACTGDNSSGSRTSNFGLGKVSPWTKQLQNEIIMQAPLAYNTTYPYAVVVYAPAKHMFGDEESDQPVVDTGSTIELYTSEPPGFTWLNTITPCRWMSVVPSTLLIGGVDTHWPGNVASPKAFVDSGGTCAYLSDPNGHVYSRPWLPVVQNPGWASTSKNCGSTSSSFTLTLSGSDKAASYRYTVDTSTLPRSVQGLTLVMCQENEYMMGQQGMNTGGISCLFNHIAIDYSGNRVGFKPKN